MMRLSTDMAAAAAAGGGNEWRRRARRGGDQSAGLKSKSGEGGRERREVEALQATRETVLLVR